MPLSSAQKLLQEVNRFDARKLKSVVSRESHQVKVVVEEKKAAVAAPIPAVPISPAKNLSTALTQSVVVKFQTNLSALEAMGFTDRKRNINALVLSCNVIEEAILSLLS